MLLSICIRKLWLCFGVLFMISFGRVSSHHFFIEDYKPHCYKEVFLPGVDVRVEYLVAQSTGEAPEVNFVIKDRNGRVKLSRETIDHGTVTVTTTTEEAGEKYAFCFTQVPPKGYSRLQNLNKTNAPKRKITLNVKTADPMREYPDLAKEKDMEGAQEILAGVENSVNDIIKKVDMMRKSAQDLTDEENNMSVIVHLLGGLTSAVIVVGGLLQVYATMRKLKHEKIF